jgi:hypothetical protein
MTSVNEKISQCSDSGKRRTTRQSVLVHCWKGDFSLRRYFQIGSMQETTVISNASSPAADALYNPFRASSFSWVLLCPSLSSSIEVSSAL